MSTPIEMTTNCPSDETLAAFVDGRLGEDERAEVMRHVAECEVCYDIVSGAWDYQAAESNVVTFRRRRPWIGALVAIAAAIAIVFLTPIRERLFTSDIERLVEVSHNTRERSTDARLSGAFPWKEHKVPRGAADTPDEDRSGDRDAWAMEAVAWDVLARNENRDSVRALHARGVAHLMLRKSDKNADHTAAAVEALTAAVTTDAGTNDLRAAIRRSTNVPLLTDLSAALHAAEEYATALEAAERAWALDRTPATGWNRALALQALRLPKADAAWQEYLALERDPQWAADARRKLE
jgi:Putative zinc-finger